MNKKVAFIGWNPFQLLFVKDLLLYLPNARFIIEDKGDGNLSFFSKELLKGLKDKIVIIKSRDIINLDGNYEVIVAQTMFTDAYKFKSSKIVWLQYGYAKEPHNYGDWRAIGDLCLCFGDYAVKKVNNLLPSIAIGYPKFNKKFIHNNLILDKNKKTILYMPTWGDLSSIDYYGDTILKLTNTYNVIVKLHHNTQYLEPIRVNKFKNKNIIFIDANEDSREYIELSDIIVTDYSGAIFDAIFYRKVLILLDLKDKKILKSKKLDTNSIEFKKRDILGYRVNSKNMLLEILEKKLSFQESEELQSLKKEIFLNTKDYKENFINAINNLINGNILANKEQLQYKKSIISKYEKSRYKIYLKNRLKYIYVMFVKIRRKFAL